MSIIVRLSKSEKLTLQKISKRGSTPTRVSRRCRILLSLHRGFSIDETAERLDCGTATVKRVRRHYRENGMDRAIYDAARSGRPEKFGTKDNKIVIALACTDPPPGRARWTIRLLAEQTNRSFGDIQRVLTKDGLKPWREKNVVHSRNNPEISGTDDHSP